MEEPPAPVAGGQWQDPKGWWRLIWCHERCHKPENEMLCNALRRAVRDMGASLICLKKANQFVDWLQRTQRPPYVLVTDWREAQPCLQSLQQGASRADGGRSELDMPACVVVLCNSLRQFGRASEWARNLSNIMVPVIVCERSNIPPVLLHGVIRTHFGEPPASGCSHADMESSSHSAARGPLREVIAVSGVPPSAGHWSCPPPWPGMPPAGLEPLPLQLVTTALVPIPSKNDPELEQAGSSQILQRCIGRDRTPPPLGPISRPCAYQAPVKLGRAFDGGLAIISDLAGVDEGDHESLAEQCARSIVN